MNILIYWLNMTNYIYINGLILGIASLGLDYSGWPCGHWFLEAIEVFWDDIAPDLEGDFFSVPSLFLKTTSWLHLTTASKLVELESCCCAQIEVLEN